MTTVSSVNCAMSNYGYGMNTFNSPINSYVSPMQNSAFGFGDDPVCKTGKETQMCIMDLWTQRERERVG